MTDRDHARLMRDPPTVRRPRSEHYDPIGAERLVNALILRAFKDAQAHHVEALVWLVTKDASKWFDMLGLDQRWLVERAGWVRHAKHVLERGHAMTPEERAFLHQAIDELEAYA